MFNWFFAEPVIAKTESLLEGIKPIDEDSTKSIPKDNIYKIIIQEPSLEKRIIRIDEKRENNLSFLGLGMQFLSEDDVNYRKIVKFADSKE
jgi:hypothetical protein